MNSEDPPVAKNHPEGVSPSPENPKSKKLWHAGTLTYTTGGLAALFFWLLAGDFAWSMKDRAIPAVLTVLLKTFGASDLLTGIFLGSLPQVISLIVAPIISFKSDRHRGPWGRRIPFLLIPTPIMILSMVALAFTPNLGIRLDALLGAHSPGLNATTLILFGVFWALFDFATTIAWTVFGALVNDVVPQVVIGRFFGLFRVVSLMAAIIFNYWLLGLAESLYTGIFLGIAILYGVGFSAMCFNVKEGEYPPRPPMDTGLETRGFLNGSKTYIRQCFSNRYYWWFYVAMAVAGLSFMPLNLFGLYFAKSIGMSLDTFGKCFALTFAISLVLAYPIGILADRFHPLRLGIFFLIFYSLICLWGFLTVHDASMFAVAVVLHGVVGGAWGTATASITQRLLPKAEYAQFASAAQVINCLFLIVFAPAAGMLLDGFDHNYHLTFILGLGLAATGVVLLFGVYTRFKALGGVKNYLPPE